MDSVRTHLVRRGAQVVLLLAPPFDRSAQEPGYIKGYPPGVRENGGQYTHAAAWIVMALARLGSGDEAAELFHMLNPVNHTRTGAGRRALPGRAVRPRRRRLRPPRARRARRLDLVHRLGRLDVPRRPREHPRAARAAARPSSCDPCIPAAWPGYAITLALRPDPLRDRGRQPGAPLPRGRRRRSSTASPSTRAPSRWSTTAGPTRCTSCSATRASTCPRPRSPGEAGARRVARGWG